MMIKLFNKEKDDYPTKGRPLGWGGGPDADWKVMVGACLILVLIGFLLSALLFYKVRGGSFGSDINASAEAPVDRNNLKRTVNFYKDRATNLESIKTTKETTPDPSI